MKIGEKITNPGEFRTRVTLQRRTIITDAGGFQRPGSEDIAMIWAKWINAHGSEVWTASSLQAEAAATVTMRYRNDVDATCLVKKGSDVFEIVSIDDIQERHEYIELKVKRYQPG